MIIILIRFAARLRRPRGLLSLLLLAAVIIIRLTMPRREDVVTLEATRRLPVVIPILLVITSASMLRRSSVAQLLRLRGARGLLLSVRRWPCRAPVVSLPRGRLAVAARVGFASNVRARGDGAPVYRLRGTLVPLLLLPLLLPAPFSLLTRCLLLLLRLRLALATKIRSRVPLVKWPRRAGVRRVSRRLR